MLPMMGLIAISGIFYPITALPGWLQWIAQVFPVYWLGLGMRSALLPDAAGGRRDRRLVAAPGDVRRARAVGGRRAGAGADRAAPDGPPRVGLEQSQPPRAAAMQRVQLRTGRR